MEAAVEPTSEFDIDVIVAFDGAKRSAADVEALLRAVGKLLEGTIPETTRATTVKMLATYIADPTENADLVPLIAKRLSGEQPAHQSHRKRAGNAK